MHAFQVCPLEGAFELFFYFVGISDQSVRFVKPGGLVTRPGLETWPVHLVQEVRPRAIIKTSIKTHFLCRYS